MKRFPTTIPEIGEKLFAFKGERSSNSSYASLASRVNQTKNNPP